MLRLTHPFGFRQSGSTLVLPRNVVYDIRADQRSRSDQLEAHVVHSKNSLGFRGPEPPADFARWMIIVAIGGSTTECFYLGDGKTSRRAARRGPGGARSRRDPRRPLRVGGDAAQPLPLEEDAGDRRPRLDAQTRQVGRERHVLVVDLARRLPKDSTFFYDFFHFTNAGADRVGAIVHDGLRPWLLEKYPAWGIAPAV